MNLWTAHWDALSVLVQSRACFPSSVRENIMKAPASSAARSPKRPAPRRSLIGKKKPLQHWLEGFFYPWSPLLPILFIASSKKYKRKAKKMQKSVDKRGKRRYTNQAVPQGTVRIGKTGQELRKKFLTKGFRSDKIIKLHFAGRQWNQRFSVESERNLEKSSWQTQVSVVR